MPFTTIEWKIIITLDKDEKEVVKISVNRRPDGLVNKEAGWHPSLEQRFG